MNNDWKKKYDYVWGFINYRAIVRIKDQNGNFKYGHVDLYGNVTTPIIYDFVSDFINDRAIVIITDKNGKEKYDHVDKSGNLISG